MFELINVIDRESLRFKEKMKRIDRKSHIAWIDLARSFAICCVILVHTLDFTFSMNLDYMSGADLHTQICAFALHTIGRLGVPVFLFISGYLLLDREYDGKACKRFWKRNWTGLLITTEVWIVLYNIFLAWYNGKRFNKLELLENMLFVNGVDMPHMWYMPVIIGIYIFLPLISVVLQRFDWRIFRLPIVIVFCYLFVVPIVIVIMNSYKITPVNSALDLSFGGGVYGFIIILGYWSKRGVFRRISKKWLLLTSAIFFVLSIMLQLFSYHHGNQWNIWYSCGFLLITAVCLFELISRINKIYFARLWKGLAECSFGIYFVHYPLLMVIAKYFTLELASPLLAVVFLVVLLISWGIVWGLGKIPKLRRILFFMK